MPAEERAVDLSDQQPERLAKMIAQWGQYKEETGVLDISFDILGTEQ